MISGFPPLLPNSVRDLPAFRELGAQEYPRVGLPSLGYVPPAPKLGLRLGKNKKERARQRFKFASIPTNVVSQRRFTM